MSGAERLTKWSRCSQCRSCEYNYKLLKNDKKCLTGGKQVKLFESRPRSSDRRVSFDVDDKEDGNQSDQSSQGRRRQRSEAHASRIVEQAPACISTQSSASGSLCRHVPCACTSYYYVHIINVKTFGFGGGRQDREDEERFFLSCVQYVVLPIFFPTDLSLLDTPHL